MERINEPDRKDVLVDFLARPKSIVQVGAGNIGSRLALELPLLKFLRIVLVDGDSVSERNLTCCTAFSHEDVGKYKVGVLGTRLRARYSATRLKVDARVQRFDRFSLAAIRDLAPCILVGAVDSRRARFELAEAAMNLGLPLVDMAISGHSDQVVARAEVSWWAINQIDPLNAWTAADWGALEHVRPCGQVATESPGETASPISGAAAAVLGLAAVRKLLAGDVSDVGFVTRLDLSNKSFVRCALPKTGESPLDPSHIIRQAPARVDASTLNALVHEAERLLGPGAEVHLRRDVSPRFVCRCCQRVELQPGVVGMYKCRNCDNPLIPLEPTSTLSRLSLGPLADAKIDRLGGGGRDLLRISSGDGARHEWVEYREIHQ